MDWRDLTYLRAGTPTQQAACQAWQYGNRMVPSPVKKSSTYISTYCPANLHDGHLQVYEATPPVASSDQRDQLAAAIRVHLHQS